MGETVKHNSSQGDPVSFAVTLFQTGEILFEYGSGNQKAIPTVGICRSYGGICQVFADYSSDTIYRNLDSAPAILWTPIGSDRLYSTIYPFLKVSDAQYTGYALINYGNQQLDYVFAAHRDGVPGRLIQVANLTAGAQSVFVGQRALASLLPKSSGWAESRSTRPTLASFYTWGDNGQSFLAGAPPALLARDLVFTHVPLGKTPSQTMVYVVNPADAPANIQARWYDSDGRNFLSATSTIKPQDRLATNLATLFPALAEDTPSGCLRIISDTAVAAVAVTESAKTPAIVTAQEPSTTADPLYAAHFVSGIAGGIAYASTW